MKLLRTLSHPTPLTLAEIRSVRDTLLVSLFQELRPNGTVERSVQIRFTVLVSQRGALSEAAKREHARQGRIGFGDNAWFAQLVRSNGPKKSFDYKGSMIEHLLPSIALEMGEDCRYALELSFAVNMGLGPRKLGMETWTPVSWSVESAGYIYGVPFKLFPNLKDIPVMEGPC